MIKRLLVGFLAVAAIVVLLAVGFSRNPDVAPDPLVGHPAPAFALKTVAGKPVTLASLRGHPLVINFFASWCISCRQQEGNLVEAFRRYHRDVRFVGIIYEDSASKAAEFGHSRGADWPDLIDSSGSTAVNYGISGIPETFFINAKGIIVAHSDDLATSSLNAGIRAALGSHRSA
jgi:cytochrome c biogenesis protein CcmG/thiol:disulfide interchange protein DsbE